MTSNQQSTHSDQSDTIEISSDEQLICNYSDKSDVILKIGENLHLNEEMADFHFIFEIADDLFERVPAHKLLLKSASDVFRTMFNGTWEENDEVEITDATIDEFKEFLQFFYLEQVKISMDKVARVMYLGNKYNITRCMNVCEQFIINTLKEDNACWAYELALVYDQENLKKYCETFIGINTKAVMTSDQFLECNKKMLGHILKLDSLSCPENEVFEACMNWVKTNAQVDQLTRELVEAQLGELFYEVRIKSMTPQGFVKLISSYGRLFSIDDLREISLMVALKEFKPNIFSKAIRIPFESLHCNEKKILHCDRHLANFRSAAWFYYIKSVEKTRFSINKPLFLTKFLCSRIYGCLSDAYYEIDELPTEITVVQMPDAEHSKDEIVLHSEVNTLQSDKITCVILPKPLLIRPDSMYEIRLKQSPPHRCCSGIMLKSEVQMESNITVTFHVDTTVEKDNVTSEMVTSLFFNQIY